MNLRYKGWNKETFSNLLNNIDLEEIHISNDLLNQSSEPDFEYSKDKYGRPPYIYSDPNHILFENFEKMEREDVKKIKATYFGSTIEEGTAPISINSCRLKFSNTTLGSPKGHCQDPMTEYQPIMKNLKNISLRNRNFINDNQIKVITVPNCEKMNEVLNDLSISSAS